MNKFSPSKITLSEYLESQWQKPYFSLLPERYLLAANFLNTCNSKLETDSEKFKCLIPFFNPSNIEIESIPQNDDGAVSQYNVLLPNSVGYGETVYQNYAFGDSNLFRVMIKGESEIKLSSPKNVLFILMSKSDYLYSIHTLATIAFCIYFGTHPFMGREYCKGLDTSPAYELNFFLKKHKFIFETEDNPNRFVNGYQSYAWQVWNALSNDQKDFWKKALFREHKSYEEFYSEWEKCYGTFKISHSQTPCAQKLKTIVFNEKYALITSDNSIGNKTIRCRGCNNNLTGKCESCQIPTEKRIATLLVVNAKVSTIGTAEEKPLALYDGRVILTKNLADSGSDDAIFEVIASKKSNILGLKYLLDEPITVNYGAQEKKYNKNDVIPLLPGMHIPVITGYEIVTPGQPPKPPEPPKQPEAPIQLDPPKQPEAPMQPDASKQPEPQKRVDDLAPPRTDFVKRKPTKSTALEPIRLETGEYCDIEFIESKPPFDLYTATSQKSGKKYLLKIFHEQKDKKNADYLNGMRDNLRNVIVDLGECPIHSSVLYPYSIMRSAGEFKNRVGFVYGQIPQGMQSLENILKNKIRFDSKYAEVSAMLELCEMIASLHENGFVHTGINLQSVFLDNRTGACRLVRNEYISFEDDPLRPMKENWTFADPCNENSNQYPKSSNVYAVAIIMFMIAFKQHPFDDCEYDYARANALTDSQKRERYITNKAKFCFADDESNRITIVPELSRPDQDGVIKVDLADVSVDASMENEARKKWNDADEVIKSMFRKTFTDGVKDARRRPDIKEWVDALRKWQQKLQSNK